MDNLNQDNAKQGKSKVFRSGVAYPVESVDSALENAKRLVEEYGSSRPISKEEISKTLNRKINSLNLFFSTLGQYSIFTVVHGKGYLPSDLYRKYTEPVHDNDEYKAKLQMFQSAPLYAKIIEQLNGHQLPADEKRFANLLKGEPYNVNANSSDRAAKVFFENCRNLNLRDATGKFKFPDLNGGFSNAAKITEKENIIPSVQPSQNLLKAENSDDLFTLPIPLDSKRKAYIKYPLQDLKKKDIRVIVKALSFIASSIVDDDETEFEISIVEKKNAT